MSDSIAFVALCNALETKSDLDRLEARGTVRVALKQAGLDARNVVAAELQVVVDKILRTELQSRGVDDDICVELMSSMTAVPAHDPSGPESPEAVFRRLGG